MMEENCKSTMSTPGTHLLLLEKEAARAPGALPVALSRNDVTFVQVRVVFIADRNQNSGECGLLRL